MPIQTHNQMPNQIPIQTHNQMPIQTHNQIHNQTHNQIHNQMPIQIDNQMPIQIDNQMPIQIDNQIDNQMPIQIDNQILEPDNKRYEQNDLSNCNYIQKKEIKRIFKLGKNKKNRTISIILHTRKKKIENKEKIQTIKKTLKKNNLIKYGTNAPLNILNEIYNSSKFCGDIINTNSNVLLHNFNINNTI